MARRWFQEWPQGEAWVGANGRLSNRAFQWVNNYVARWLGRYTGAEMMLDPDPIASGGTASATVAFRGAKPGDMARASFSALEAGITISADVTDDDVVTVWFQNLSSGSIDLDEGTLYVEVKARG